MSALIIAGREILAGSTAFFSFWIFFFTPGVAGGGGGGDDDDSAGVASVVALGAGFAAFIGIGLATRFGLLSAGGAAF